MALWTNRYNAPGSSDDYAFGVAVDRSGNVFVSGSSGTIAYSGAGVPLWTNVALEGGALAVDVNGNVFVFESGSSRTIAYSGAGVPLWTNVVVLSSAWAVDGSGNVVVTGGNFVTIKYSSAIPPSLTIGRTATNTVAVSWPSPSTGFTLQQNTDGVATVNWSNILATPSDDGTTRTVIVDPPTGNRFYRLFHP